MAEAVAADTKKAPRKPIKTRPKLDLPPESPQKILSFMKRIAGFAAEDWGTRVKVYCYRVEPVIDRTRSGETKYIMSYSEPISEDRLLMDHGSGRYKLILNFRKPGAETGDEVDSVYVEIMNPKHPPKMSLGEWVDDPRNKKWAWAKELLEEAERKKNAQPAGTESVVDSFRVFNEIQESMERRTAQPQGAGILETVRAVKELMPAPPPPSQETGMFQVLMQTMAQQSQNQTNILLAQIASSANENKELRAELREIRTNGNAGNGGFSFVKELIAEVKTILPEIKEFFPAAERPRNLPWWAGSLENLTAGVAPVLPALIGKFMSGPPAPAPGYGAVPPALRVPAGVQSYQPPPAAPVAAPATIDIENMLLSALDREQDGTALAEALDTFFGEEGSRAYKALRKLGDAGILELLKSRPVWAQLGAYESQLPQFIREFIEYGEDEPASADAPVKTYTADPLEHGSQMEVL